jgi:hypothetical protein
MARSRYDIRIDRRTPFGNRHYIGRDGTRAEVIAKHMADCRALLASHPTTRDAFVAELDSMRGKRLGCHCKPLACHGDNYVTLIGELFCDAQD